ncbi:uncharacterized protein DUF397 [Murinocardiopsis flavida]|uniref:Uncharacterized protein DUF397 n=1 Tax=Murinocardiopsis flavida TaxID=645275 RepID=A0A2P8DJS5_9ACTN|nr:DUF397 domain-containing protein [Murinocardiopsis flavida]PSK97470.1 uncharacterized protein DUF397 [Murinocardiopsis flavida]
MTTETGSKLRKAWRTASYSRNQTACVEVADFTGNHGVRDSKNLNIPAMFFTPEEWSAFVKAVKLNEL